MSYEAQPLTLLRSLLGMTIVFALFPILGYTIDAYTRYSGHNPYTDPILVFLAMGAGGLGSIAVSSAINGLFVGRDLNHGIIAGAIAVGAASLYITEPVYALVCGAGAGIFQGIIGSLMESNAAQSGSIVSTVSWSLFGFQGLLGAAFSAGWKAIAFTRQ